MIFSKEKILNKSISSHGNYCAGYHGTGGYIITPVVSIGSFKESFSHDGPDILDFILAYDKAESDDVYIGQINMIVVSSFCGPEGLIWGYDIAHNESSHPQFLSDKDIDAFKGIKLRDGGKLREASRLLFGTNEKRNFPLLPGSHVYCAARWCSSKGPNFAYSSVAIGIPEDRNKQACLIMEDIGHLSNTEKEINNGKKQEIIINLIRSILEVGKNQKITYKEIFVDFVYKEIKSGEIGCSLVAVPYFQLAKKAYDKNLCKQSLQEWFANKKTFINN